MMPPETQAQAAGAAPLEASEFESLLNKEFKARDTQKQTAVQNAVRTLAQQALASTQLVSADVTKTISAMIAEIDKKLSEQINLILHHEDFKALEGSWRGLHYLVNNTETDETLKIRVLNISKTDLKKTLKKFEGTAWDQSPLFKKLYEDEFGSPGGQPYGAFIGDYHFDHSPEDVKLLGNIAQIASAMHAPFIAGAAPSVLAMDSWQELSNPRSSSRKAGRPACRIHPRKASGTTGFDPRRFP
jgi:type VI secretion system protein ImpC